LAPDKFFSNDFGKQDQAMTLASGKKLARYEIRSKIGDGGMALFKIDPLSFDYDLAAGKRFIIVNPAPGTQSVPFTVVLNWTAELKR
jgi:hypothetical protein